MLEKTVIYSFFRWERVIMECLGSCSAYKKSLVRRKRNGLFYRGGVLAVH